MTRQDDLSTRGIARQRRRMTSDMGSEKERLAEALRDGDTETFIEAVRRANSTAPDTVSDRRKATTHQPWPCYDLCPENLTGLGHRHCTCGRTLITPTRVIAGETGIPWRHAEPGVNRHE